MMKWTGAFTLLAAPFMVTSALAQEQTPTPEIIIDRNEPLFEYHFGYSPTGDSALDTFLRREAGRLEEEGRSEWREGQDYARRHAPQRPLDRRYSYWHEYFVKGQTPQLISLSVTRWAFTGGAHGNGWSDSLLWDRQNRDVIRFQSLFSDWLAASLVLREPVCFAIDRATYLREGGNPQDYTGQDDGLDPNLPDGCPGVANVELIPVGNIGQPFDRLLIRYTSGAYIMGIVEAEIPVTAELTGLLVPRWRPAFRAAPVDATVPTP